MLRPIYPSGLFIDHYCLNKGFPCKLKSFRMMCYSRIQICYPQLLIQRLTVDWHLCLQIKRSTSQHVFYWSWDSHCHSLLTGVSEHSFHLWTLETNVKLLRFNVQLTMGSLNQQPLRPPPVLFPQLQDSPSSLRSEEIFQMGVRHPQLPRIKSSGHHSTHQDWS